MMFWKRNRAESPRSRSHSVPQLWGGKQESLGREEKVRGTGLGKEGCVIVKRAFVCPGGRKRGMLASLPKAGAWLNLSGGRKQGRKRARSTGRLHRSSRAVTGRGPGQRSSFARLVRTWLHWGRVGQPPASPPPLRWALTQCPARHPIGTAPSAAREMLVPRQGLKALNACAHQKTLRREQWVCSVCSQRGQGRAQKSWPQLMQGQEQSVPLLCSTMSCTNSESGSENFFSRGSEGTGVLPFSKAQGKKPGADEKALESSF